MGSKITDLLETKELRVEDLKDKILAVDAFNTLYMFLTTIRGADGSPLMDSKGRITSHLQGLLSRFLKYVEQDIKFVFVFDGKPPVLKEKETQRRRAAKKKALELYNKAKDEKDFENMKKYAARTTFLTEDIIDQTKKVLDLMGIPWIQAPSEGEAQAAYLVKKGDAYAVVSQDADALLFGTPKLIKNLSLSGRVKKQSTQLTKKVMPELINLKNTLENLGINQEQLINLAILVGTDYNYGGIKGIGPKKALKLVKTTASEEEIFEKAKWEEHMDISWKEIKKVIQTMPVTDDYTISFQKPDIEGVEEYLKSFEFGEERINNFSERLQKLHQKRKQKDLSQFF